MRTLTDEEINQVSGGCKRNNGWGNGDDQAPGNSLTHNRAENNVRAGAHHVVWGEPARPYSYGGCDPDPHD